ncbi:anti-phage dCTP deaminase [Pseudomonas aeruginosa]|uniref:anti-phage dCTP deaminase n=1 Tax=Pseudomonas aeruginosa TaxID=287 RepID=UPI0022BA222A|nr:anti-phage dCTP deaminase [Pseudomonas aeruginosa]WBJ79660.1 hypothetical protein PALA50_05616 [Pseudomonas aeruginosa]HCF4373736.1 deoxycytidylate deaminase [Pseudomonas aeruginosa]
MADPVVKQIEQVADINKVVPIDASNEVDDGANLFARIRSRRSKEIVIGLAGAVGCNLADVVQELKRQFLNYNYEVKHLKISDIIKAYYTKNGLPTEHFGKDLYNLRSAERYRTLQDLGNLFRQNLSNFALAAQVIKNISVERELQVKINDTQEPPRTVYIVDQLKHPEEVELFRSVYNNVFYLVGVLSPEDARLAYLKQEDIDSVAAQELIERDRNENVKHGQKLEKTIQHADFFVRHTLNGSQTLAKPCQRFVGLVHGTNGITPTQDEAGMYAAHSASLKSACLSRQVGAAIADDRGNILSTGWNDVPKPGGGLYVENDETYDQRCVHLGKCYNDFYKNKLVEKIIDVVSPSIKGGAESARILSERILRETPVGSLIEYSRAVHAEMEAILNMARLQSGSTDGTILYSTTYPCHNCARHIIASGIKRVVYIEPYEKSLATTLHFDAISDTPKKDRIVFENFEGVAPRKYLSFFSSSSERKDAHGRASQVVNKDAELVTAELLDSYLDVESKVVEIAARNFAE